VCLTVHWWRLITCDCWFIANNPVKLLQPSFLDNLFLRLCTLSRIAVPADRRGHIHRGQHQPILPCKFKSEPPTCQSPVVLHWVQLSLSKLIERNHPPRGEFPLYYVPSSRTRRKRTPLEEFVPGASRGVLSKHLVLLYKPPRSTGIIV